MCATAHLYQKLPLEQIAPFQKALLAAFAQQCAPLMDRLEQGLALTQDDRTQILEQAGQALERFQSSSGR